MDADLIWQVVLIFIVGTLYLRISGRKSIAQMTMPQTIMMIALGTLIIQPVTGHGLWTTFFVAALLVGALLATEFVQLKFDTMETMISGKAVAVIQDGQIIEVNLKKLRLTVDKLETRIRQLGIASIQDIQIATIEVNGLLGYTLKPEKQPATKEDIEKIITILLKNGQVSDTFEQNTKADIFTEVVNKKASPPPPDYLQ